MKLKFVLFEIILCSCACFAQQPTTINQGLTGYIYLVKGNQMPTPRKPLNKGRGVIRDIYIYQPTSTTDVIGSIPLFTGIKSHLVTKTRSDSTGYYSIKLPEGKYSIFVKIGSQYFASETDGAGILNPAEVKIRKITHKNIVLNNQAAY